MRNLKKILALVLALVISLSLMATANITGYETLAMTLRALGYGKNSEFEGGEWKIQTAA